MEQLSLILEYCNYLLSLEANGTFKFNNVFNINKLWAVRSRVITLQSLDIDHYSWATHNTIYSTENLINELKSQYNC